VKGTTGPAEDPGWAAFASPISAAVTQSYTFNYPGSYVFVCQVHQGMNGTVTVTGDPVEPTPTPTPPVQTPTPPAQTPTPAPTVGPSGTPPSGTIPAPSGGAADTAAPALTALRVRPARHGAKVTFRLSETSTVVVRVKKRGARHALRTFRLQARAGTRTITLRSARLKRGRYTVELQARDARGNTSSLARGSVRVQRP
jgi:hypothetical protein